MAKINDKKIIQSDIKIFPNPVADIFNIDVSKADKKIKTIEILDMVGNCVYKTESIQPIISVNSSDYTKGMYIVRILFNDVYYQIFKILKYK
ncbi:MAG: T9SS type A sorting domain-containing protein [Chitinophagales bacterium]